MREANYRSIHPDDLAFLFKAYDHEFFGGLIREALAGRRVEFRLAPRLTKAGGKTTRYKTRTGEISFEIAVASSMLFDAFGPTDRPTSACGRECANRLEALQRIFEHELVHLVEQICWDTSNCSAAQFQGIARRLFLHEAHTHDLITRRERAAVAGIRVGAKVTFNFEGKQHIGRVNRVTKRATVLVPDINGKPYSDGVRYQTFYVPIGQLKLI